MHFTRPTNLARLKPHSTHKLGSTHELGSTHKLGSARSWQVSWERRDGEERPSPPPDNDSVFPGFVLTQVGKDSVFVLGTLIKSILIYTKMAK